MVLLLDGRRRDIAVAAALGAGKMAQAAELLLEVLTLYAFGGCVGIGISAAFLPGLANTVYTGAFQLPGALAVMILGCGCAGMVCGNVISKANKPEPGIILAGER